MKSLTLTSLVLLASGSLAPTWSQAYGSVKAEQKVSDTQGGFTGTLHNGDRLGWSLTFLGDLDGDGIGDLAAGAPFDDGGVLGTLPDRGAVWILFMNADGTVRAHQKINGTNGGFGGTLDNDDNFGWSVAGLGDLDGDGVADLAVGAPKDDDVHTDFGAVWILFLHANGTVKARSKITGFANTDPFDGRLGSSLAALGDLDGDGIVDLAVGSPNIIAGGLSKGGLWILFLNADGSVKAQQKIGESTGGFGGALYEVGWFAWSLAALGDLDGDGVGELAVGTPHDIDGSYNRGAVWILFLDSNGTVKTQQKLSSLQGGLVGPLDTWDEFGSSVAGLGDLDGDGLADLAVGAERDSDMGTERGGAWVLRLDSNGTVKAEQKLNELVGGFGGTLDPQDYFGGSLACPGDLDGDGVPDLACGAFGDSDGGGARGAFWNLFLVGPDTQPPVIACPSAIEALDSKGGTPGTLASFSVTAADAIDPAPSLVCVPPSGSFFPRGTTIVTCTATDATGNQAVRTFPVHVHPSVRVR